MRRLAEASLKKWTGVYFYGRESVLKDIGNHPKGAEGDSEHESNVEMVLALEGRLPSIILKRRNLLQNLFKQSKLMLQKPCVIFYETHFPINKIRAEIVLIFIDKNKLRLYIVTSRLN